MTTRNDCPYDTTAECQRARHPRAEPCAIHHADDDDCIAYMYLTDPEFWGFGPAGPKKATQNRDWKCPGCGVLHGRACARCGRRDHHAPGCIRLIMCP
jgi:hypothetical protein